MQDSSEAPKKKSKTRKRVSRRKKEKKRLKRKFRLTKRLERYRKIFEFTKAARVKARQLSFGLRLPGKFLEIPSRVITSARTAVQSPLPPFGINPQQAMSGNCFWLNYQSVFNWKDHHTSNVSAYLLPGSIQQPCNPQIYKGCEETREVNTPRDNERYVNGSSPEREYYVAGDSETADEENGGQVEEPDEDIVVTEEMMQFLEISMRHKANREREKQAAKELERQKRIERDTIEGCQVPAEEDENEKRLREMSELYGKEAAKIHGMETALQLNFNRQLDLFNPPPWPFYAFSMKFDGVTAIN